MGSQRVGHNWATFTSLHFTSVISARMTFETLTFYFFILTFCIRVDEPCCFIFKCTTQWFSIHIHVSFHFQILFPFRWLHNIEQTSLSSTVGPCWLSILNIVCPSPSSFSFLIGVYLLYSVVWLSVAQPSESATRTFLQNLLQKSHPEMKLNKQKAGLPSPHRQLQCKYYSCGHRDTGIWNVDNEFMTHLSPYKRALEVR